MPLRTGPLAAQEGTLIFICSDGHAWGTALAKTLQLLDAAEHALFVPDFDAMRVAEQLRPYWPDYDDLDIPYLGTCIAHPRPGDLSGPLSCLQLLAQLRNECWYGGFIGVFYSIALAEEFLSFDAFGGPPNGPRSLVRLGNVHRAIVAPLSVGELLGDLAAVGSTSHPAWSRWKANSHCGQVRARLEAFVTMGCDDLAELDNIRNLARVVAWDSLGKHHQESARITRLLREGPGQQRNGWARKLLRLIQRS